MDVYVEPLHGHSPSTLTSHRALLKTGLPLTAVLGQETQQCVHLLEGSSINQAATIALLRDQPRVHQLLQVKGERRVGDGKFLGDGTRRHPVWTGYNE
ncbi:protein of unknown function (plasmid) [Pararobbsia alpina]